MVELKECSTSSDDIFSGTRLASSLVSQSRGLQHDYERVSREDETDCRPRANEMTYFTLQCKYSRLATQSTNIDVIRRVQRLSPEDLSLVSMVKELAPAKRCEISTASCSRGGANEMQRNEAPFVKLEIVC